MFGYAIIVTGLCNLCAAFVDSITPSVLIICGHRKNESVKTVSAKKSRARLLRRLIHVVKLNSVQCK